MAQIYTNSAGASVYDNGGQTFDAKTGQVYSAAPANQGVNTSSTSSSSNNGDAFMQQLQQSLLSQSGIISSSNTAMEDKINEAISGIQSGAKSNAAAITSQYDRNKGYTAEAGAQKQTSFQEAQRGYATNTAALKQISDDTTKQLNDLEQRKQELILQGNATAAGQVSEIQLQAIQFRQQAQQQVFTNLLGMANFGLQKQQQQAQQDQFNRTMQFNESSAMSQIALQYGLNTQPGETLTSLYSRATKDMGANSPAALALKQAKSTIDANNAQIAKINSDINANKALSGSDIDILANSYLAAGAGALSNVKDSVSLGKVIARAGEIKAMDLVSSDKNAGTSKLDSRNGIINSSLSAPEKTAALNVLDKVYGLDSAQPKTGAQGNVLDSFTDWFTANVLGEPGMVQQAQKYRAMGI